MMGERKAPRPEPLEPTNAVGRRRHPRIPPHPNHMAAARGFVWTPAPGAIAGWTLRGCVLQRLQMQLTVASSDSSPWRLGTDGLGEAACIAIAGTQGRWAMADGERRRRVRWMGTQTGWVFVLAIKVAGAGPSVWGASLDCKDYSALAVSV
jgi:hypothetical protein